VSYEIKLTYSSSVAGIGGSRKSCLSGARTNNMGPTEKRFRSIAVCWLELNGVGARECATASAFSLIKSAYEL
jgi:hypothetical protein